MTTPTSSNDNLYSVDGVQAKVREGLAKLDSELSQYKYCNELERRTGVPKSYVVLGGGAVIFVMIFFNLAGKFLTSLISWAYPAYASFKAIESSSSADDKQWLVYWTVIGFVQLVEFFAGIILYYFPMFYLIKTLFVLWLALPQFRGAEVLYGRFLRPYLLNAQSDIDKHAEQLRQKVGEAVSDITSTKKD
ncbi:hypothetical protein O0I10_004523 [Lichtheimia ornata]|uniref:Protein YOP1 n=1 Tax=Lichtheimia ornata TaxID=688661 RepID=A0AAD7XZA9_9FUNG|nr:uncharacterized protein O0I10_004523 [Lichtheimia ornata]KAJ8659930.1 hypothetical protein O0I10_004523 [Lichtheimia ornata]